MRNTYLTPLRWFLLAVLTLLGWFHYRTMLSYTIVFIQAPIEDMSHAWVIPVVSIGAIWLQRDEFRKAAGLPSWRGLGWACLFLVVAWFGAKGGQARIEQVSMIGLIWSIPYALWGRDIGRLMLFPAGFLLFTVPISSYLDFFTVHLRMLSSGMATAILNGFGAEIERMGTSVRSYAPGHEFSVDVADPCSGIRSLFALMALTVGYAQFMLKTRFQRWLLFACSIPIAVVGNMFRIFSICLVALCFGQQLAMGFYHDYSGFVIFGIGFLLVQQTAKHLPKFTAWLQRKKALPDWVFAQGETVSAPDRQPDSKQAVIIACLTAGLVILTFEANRFSGAPTVDAISFIADDLPHQIPGYTSDHPWFCHNDQCNAQEEESMLTAKQLQDGDGFKCPLCGGPMRKISAGELRDLPKDTEILKRTYRSPAGNTYFISVVISGKNRGSIHRPELCLPAQGFVMLKTDTCPLRVPGGKPHQARAILAQSSSVIPPVQFSLAYWFISREHECSSHAKRILIDIWDRSIRNRINRWAMVSVNATPPLNTQESMEAFEAFLGDFYPRIFRSESTAPAPLPR